MEHLVRGFHWIDAVWDRTAAAAPNYAEWSPIAFVHPKLERTVAQKSCITVCRILHGSGIIYSHGCLCCAFVTCIIISETPTKSAIFVSHNFSQIDDGESALERGADAPLLISIITTENYICREVAGFSLPARAHAT